MRADDGALFDGALAIEAGVSCRGSLRGAFSGAFSGILAEAGGFLVISEAGLTAGAGADLPPAFASALTEALPAVVAMLLASAFAEAFETGF